jgi:outer membrane protein assembly factor BamB
VETFIPQEGLEQVHPKNGYASATPATDGHRVYASFGRHGLAAFDFSGKLLWHRRFGVIDNYHGPAGSPVLYKDRIFLYQDQNPTTSQTAFVAAFDKATGKTLWHTPRSETVGWGTAVVIDVGARDELVVSSQRRVAAYDPDTGRELWTVRGMTFEVIPTPVVGHGLVFAPPVAPARRLPFVRAGQATSRGHTSRGALPRARPSSPPASSWTTCCTS